MWKVAVLPATAVIIILLASPAWGQCFTSNDDSAGGAVATDAEEILLRGATEFALNLFASVHRGGHNGPTDNVIISPFSIWAGLTATWFGARGRTKQQMEDVLKYGDGNQKRVYGLYQNLTSGLQHNASELSNYTLNLANRAYIDLNFQVRECILDYLSSEIEKLPLRSQSEESRRIINQWVEEQTNGRIVDLLPQGSIDVDTVMVLVNTVYFKSNWANVFVPELTKLDDFHIEPNLTIKIDMMHHTNEWFRIARSTELQCSAIELPYVGDDIRMVILLPDGAVSDLVAKLSASSLKQLVSGLSRSVVDLWMPKFKVEQSLELIENLRGLGISDLFIDGVANLSGLVADEHRSPYVQFVRHVQDPDRRNGERHRSSRGHSHRNWNSVASPTISHRSTIRFYDSTYKAEFDPVPWDSTGS